MSEQANVYWSPDNRWLAAITDGEGVMIWDAYTAEHVATLAGTITHAAWSPDAAYIATGDVDKTVTVWDANWQPQFQVEGVGAVWSPDGTRLVTRSGKIIMWDALTGQEIYSLKAADTFDLYYEPIAWSPDGTRLAAGDADGIITVWNTEDGAKLVEWQGHYDIINVVSWSPDGTQLVSGSGALFVNNVVDASAIVWDAETGQLRHKLHTYRTAVISAAWSPDSKWIFTGSLEFVDVFDTQDWDADFFLAAFDPQWSSDSQHILAGNIINSQAIIYDTTGKKILALSGHKAGVNNVAWSPDGIRVASASLDGTARMWDISQGRSLLSFADDYYYQPVWSKVADQLWISNINDDRVYLWDVPAGTHVLDGPQYTLDVAPGDSPRFVGYWQNGDGSFSLRVIDEQNRVTTNFDAHQDVFSSAKWSPDGREIASGSVDNTLFIWNPDTGQVRLQLPGYKSVWSPDGSRLAVISLEAGDSRQKVIIYDAVTGDTLQTLALRPNQKDQTYVGQVEWSADGTRIATSTEQEIGAGNLIEIWDAASGERLYTLQGVRFSWSPDGTRIASVQLDGTVAVQNLMGEVIYSIREPDESLSDVAWSPSGEYIATTNRHDIITVWRAWQTTAELIDYANECCVIRDLTDEEKAQFGLDGSGGS
jgi:WD40 repeat protein